MAAPNNFSQNSEIFCNETHWRIIDEKSKTLDYHFVLRKRSTTNWRLKYGCKSLWKTLLLHSVTRVCLFSPDEGLCYVFFDPKQFLWISCILWCYFHSVIQSYLKMPVCDASLSYLELLEGHNKGTIIHSSIFKFFFAGAYFHLSGELSQDQNAAG